MAVCRMSRADVVHMYIVEHVVGCRNLQYNTREEVVYTRRTQKNPEGEEHQPPRFQRLTFL
jgi:hypothetical protein